jgi:hypothetical protein
MNGPKKGRAILLSFELAPPPFYYYLFCHTERRKTMREGKGRIHYECVGWLTGMGWGIKPILTTATECGLLYYSCSKSLCFTGTDPRGGLYRKPPGLRGAIAHFYCSLEAEAKIIVFFLNNLIKLVNYFNT